MPLTAKGSYHHLAILKHHYHGKEYNVNVNPRSRVARISRNSLLETGAISELTTTQFVNEHTVI